MKRWNERSKEMIKSFFRRIFPISPQLRQADQELQDINKRLDELSAALDGENKWFLRCNETDDKVVCESVVARELKNEKP